MIPIVIGIGSGFSLNFLIPMKKIGIKKIPLQSLTQALLILTFRCFYDGLHP